MCIGTCDQFFTNSLRASLSQNFQKLSSQSPVTPHDIRYHFQSFPKILRPISSTTSIPPAVLSFVIPWTTLSEPIFLWKQTCGGPERPICHLSFQNLSFTPSALSFHPTSLHPQKNLRSTLAIVMEISDNIAR
jgi:hypothetical protein